MSTARIVVLTLVLGAGGIAASLAGASAEAAETLARVRQTGTAASALRGNPVANAAENISEHQVSRRSESVNGVRQRIAILTTAQK